MSDSNNLHPLFKGICSSLWNESKLTDSSNEEIMIQWCKDHPECPDLHADLLVKARAQDRINRDLAADHERLKKVFKNAKHEGILKH